MIYTEIINSTSIRREADNAVIPSAAGNADWQEYLDWVANGGILLPPTRADIVNAKRREVEDYAKTQALNAISYGGHDFAVNDYTVMFYRDAALCCSLGASPEAGFGFSDINGVIVQMQRVDIPVFYRLAYEHMQHISVTRAALVASFAGLSDADLAALDVPAAFSGSTIAPDGWDEIQSPSLSGEIAVDGGIF